MEQPTTLHVEAFPPCTTPITQTKCPPTYYGFQNDSQDPFHQSRKPVCIELGFEVGIHDVSFAGRAESEGVVRTSRLCQRVPDLGMANATPEPSARCLW